MEMISKYQQFQNVVVSGNYTGIGDIGGVIYEVDFNEVEDAFYYLVNCTSIDSILYYSHRFYVNEKFLSL